MDKSNISRRNGGRGVEARKRPGTANLNRPKNPIRANQSAYQIHPTHTYSGQRLATVADFLTASEDDTDFEPNTLVTPIPPFQNAPSQSYYSSESSDGEDAPNDKLPSPSDQIETNTTIQSNQSGTGLTKMRPGTETNESMHPALMDKNVQKIPITSQSTNTQTTWDGVPPLEAIHGGYGLRHPFTLSRSQSDSDSDEDDFEERKEPIKRLRVSNSIYFDKSSGRRESYGAVLFIDNKSDYNMSYSVKTSSPDLFVIQPQIGMIEPRGMMEVLVKTNPKFDFHFSDISSEVFHVLGTPVFSRGQMEMEKIDVLWRAYGTKFFPRVVAETHIINGVYSMNSQFSETLMKDMIRHVRSYWGNDKAVIVNENPVTEIEFLNSWGLEDDNFAFLSCRKQVTDWLSLCRRTKKEMRRMKLEMRQCFASIIFALSVLLIFFALGYQNDNKTSLGQVIFNDVKDFILDRISSPQPPEPVPVQNLGIGATTMLMINRILNYWTI